MHLETSSIESDTREVGCYIEPNFTNSSHSNVHGFGDDEV